MEMIRKFLFSPTVSILPLPGHREKWISGLGGAIGIALTFLVSRQVLGNQFALLVVASMGASAVLLYAVPHSVFSSPWAVIGGHVVSALSGVLVALFVPDPLIATPLAVGCAITAMYYLNCIHPPGGATAFVAVMGGPAIRALGFGYAIFPIMLNASIMVAVAVVFNRLLRSRQEAHVREVEAHLHLPEKYLIRHSDLVYAISEIQSYIDVSEADLMHIYNLAIQHAYPGEMIKT